MLAYADVCWQVVRARAVYTSCIRSGKLIDVAGYTPTFTRLLLHAYSYTPTLTRLRLYRCGISLRSTLKRLRSKRKKWGRRERGSRQETYYFLCVSSYCLLHIYYCLCVSSYYLLHIYYCLCVSSYYSLHICVLILLHVCILILLHICVLIQLHLCPHTAAYTCPHTALLWGETGRRPA